MLGYDMSKFQDLYELGLSKFSGTSEQELSSQVQELVKDLELAATDKRKKGSARKSQHTVYNSPQNTQLTSWKFQEWDYGRPNVKLPSNARGIFTMFNESTQLYEIVIRGYDKFFNIGEMQSVSKEVLLKHTKGPYSLSVKSNGCIVFISGLADGTLVVCSKHATGETSPTKSSETTHGSVTVERKNHALAAQSYLENQLRSINIDPRELALLAHKMKITLVAEYCDDEFEEHVLEYSRDKAGLYLHGINLNTPMLKTFPLDEVAIFARRFGFKETEFFTNNSLEESFKFLEECAKTGTYNGQEIEGFVVRCTRGIDNSDYFFKYKFDEPYMLYRRLREVTKIYISQGYNKINFNAGHKLVCIDYLRVVIPILEANPELKNEFMKNKYVIELRKKYFESKNKTALDILNEENNAESLEDEVRAMNLSNSSTRYILVSVATIGCGKTTTALTLLNLFPNWSHIQSDNIRAPVGNKLMAMGLEALVNSSLVILDKNNHQYRERAAIFKDFDTLNTLLPRSKVKIVCLNFVSDSHDAKLWNITERRVLDRGDNHQSIKASSQGYNSARGIMKGFINRFQPVNRSKDPDNQFDMIIDLNVDNEDSSLTNAKRIIASLAACDPNLIPIVPSDEEIKEAYNKALYYKPEFHKQISKKKKAPKPTYFGISVPSQILLDSVERLLASAGTSISDHLSEDRIQESFHITLIHSATTRNGDSRVKGLWNSYCGHIFKKDIDAIGETFSKDEVDVTKVSKVNLPSKCYASVDLKSVYWSEKVMCVLVDNLQIYNENGESWSTPLEAGNKYLHVTIGTTSRDIRPMESNNLLCSVLDFADIDQLNTAQHVDFKGTVRLNNLPLFASYK